MAVAVLESINLEDAGPKQPPAPAPPPPPSWAPPAKSKPERPRLHYDRRWGSWRPNAVEVVAVIWADLQVQMVPEAPEISKVMQEIKKKLSETLGKDAVISSSPEVGPWPIMVSYILFWILGRGR